MCSVGVGVLRHTIFITTVIPYVWYDTISICVFRCPQSKRDQAEVHGHGARGRPQQHRLGRRIDASVYRCSRRCAFFIRGVLLKKWKVLVHRSGGWKEKVEESYKYSQSQRLTYYLVRSTCYSWCILWSKHDTKLAKISFWGKKCCVFLFQAISQPSFFFFSFLFNCAFYKCMPYDTKCTREYNYTGAIYRARTSWWMAVLIFILLFGDGIRVYIYQVQFCSSEASF